MPYLLVFLITVVLTLSGCATRKLPAPAASVTLLEPEPPNGWQALATGADQRKLAELPSVWTEALAAARVRHARDVAREGPLLDPTIGLTRPEPPPGTYWCRIVTLSNTRRAYQAFRPQVCFVVAEPKLLVLMKATGTALPGGRLWTDSDTRMVFLGTMADRPGAAAPAYGKDPSIDRAGVLERIGDFRWRLTTPHPADGVLLEVMELTPNVAPMTASAR